MLVALGGADEGVVGADRGLEHVGGGPAEHVEHRRRLRRAGDRDRAVGGVPPRQAALGHHRADAAGGVERRDADAAGAQPLGERALRGQLDLDLAAEVLPGELLVLTDVGADDAADPARREQQAEPPAVDAAVVRHDLEIRRGAVEQRADQHDRHAVQAEAADGEGRAVGDVRDRLARPSPTRLSIRLLLLVGVGASASASASREDALRDARTRCSRPARPRRSRSAAGSRSAPSRLSPLRSPARRCIASSSQWWAVTRLEIVTALRIRRSRPGPGPDAPPRRLGDEPLEVGRLRGDARPSRGRRASGPSTARRTRMPASYRSAGAKRVADRVGDLGRPLDVRLVPGVREDRARRARPARPRRAPRRRPP